MANVATTKYQSANGGDWVEIKLEWSYTNTATKATISAALYVRRDGYGPTEGADQYWISLNGTKFVDSSGYHTIGTSFVQVCSGSKTIDLTNGGASATSLTLDGYYNNNLSSTKLHALRVNKASYSGGYWTTSYGTQGSPLTGTVPAQASACTAPTSVTLAVNGSTNTIIVPNGTIKVSWSGAAGGTNNPINGYIIYYRVGANPTTSSGGYTGTTSINSTATSGSVTFTLSNAERGKAIYVGVITRCATSSYNSGLKTGGGNITVNILPNAPSIKTDAFAAFTGAKTQTIINTKSNVYATATVGSDTYSVSTPVVKHNTSNSHSGETNFTAGDLSCGTSGSLTHYFWTYDGLEYSAVTTLTVTKLAKPTITTKPTITASTYTAKNSNTYTYQVNFGNIVSNFSSGKYYIQYWMRAGSSGGEWKDYTTGNFSATTFNPGKTFAFESYLPATVTSNYSFWFRVRTSMTDSAGSIDYGTWWYYGANSAGTKSGETEYIYAGPWSNPSVAKGTPSFNITITNDTRLTTWTITAKKGSSAFSVTASTSVSGNNRSFSISSADSSGDTITYTITGTNGTITKSTSFSRTMRKKTTVTSITFSSTTMNVYASTTPSGTITVKGVRGDDFNSSPSGAIAAVRGTTTQSTGKSVSVAAGANTSYEVTASVSLTDFFDGNTKALGIAKSSRYGLSTYQFKVTFTNSFNEAISLTSGNYNLNFDIAPTITFSIKYKNSTGDTAKALGSHYIQQGQILLFDYSITNYTYRALTVSIQRGSSSSSTTEIVSTSIAAANAGADALAAKTITGTLTYTVPEVNDSSIYWKAIVTQSGTNTQANYGITTSNVIRFTSPTNFQITNIIPFQTSTDSGYTVSYTLGSLGVTPRDTDPKCTAKVVLKYGNGTTFGSEQNMGTAQSGTLKFSGTILDTTNTFYLVLTTRAPTTDGYIKNSHTLNSNVRVVYVQEPVVAYRKDQLGIHTKSPASDAFLDIRTTDNKEILYIKKGTDTMLKISFEGTNVTVFDIP